MDVRKFLLLNCITFLLGSLAFGQGSISGKVTREDGSAVAGATVVLKQLTIGALTGEDGSYRVSNVPAGDHILTVSFVGLGKQEIEISVVSGQNTEVNPVMTEDIVTLEDVVVVGYGTARKRDLVGSVVKVNSEELNETIGASFETALQGKTPGVQIVQSSGVAGAGAVIRVRGIGSLSSGGDPLYVVDGIPITQDNFLNGETGGVNNNPLSSINPDDIESVEVLKDASAAAIYGSRGSNGVILITTKRGTSGKPKFNFNTRIGLSEPSNMVDFLNAEEWVMVQQEAWENDGGVGRVPLPLNLSYEDIAGVNTDWMDEVLQTGVKQEYNLSMRQGNKKLKSYVGLSYIDAESYQVGNSFQRLTGRANIDYNLLPNLTVSLSTSLARGLNNRIDQAWSGGMGYAMSTALPIYPVKDENGDWFNLYGNPVAQRELKDWRTLEWRTINNFGLNFKPMDGMSIQANGSYDYMDLGDYFLEDSLWTTVGTIAKGFQSKVRNWMTNATLSYDDFIPSENHRLSLLVGAEYQGSDNQRHFEEYQHVYSMLYTNPDLSNSDTLNFGDEEVDRWFFASAFTRLNYSFKDKFLLQGTFRRDGSSKFGRNKRFGNFPSVGIGYIVSEEPWFQNKFVTFMKLKSSWGVTGNADIDWREQFPIYYPNNVGGVDNSAGYNGNPVRNQIKLENPNLQWEVSNTYDVGIELGLFNDRITTDLTYYYKLTTDAIINIAIQASSGIDNLIFAENVGTIENQGIEFGLTTQNLIGKFRWKTELNVAHNRNLVLEVGTATPDALDGGFGDTRAVPGYPVNTNFIVKFSHVDPQTGRPVYLDINGETTSEYSVVKNRQAAGDGMPLFTGGITNSFSYSNWDLKVLFSFSYGGMIYDDAAKRHLGVVTEDWNMRREVLDRWRKPGDEAKFPQLTRSMINWGGNANFWQNNHTLWLEDGSFVRLRNVVLGYNFNNLQKGPFNNIRVAVSGTNLLTFTNYSGWDPEVARGRTSPGQRNIGGTNITYLTPPQERTYNLSLNFQF